MDKETKERIKNKELVKKYPFLAIKPWGEEEIEYDTTWYDSIPEGWWKAFGEQMCDELLEILKEGNCVGAYSIIEIKEKWGSLRWFGGFGFNEVSKSVWNKYDEWLDKYEELSEKTCIRCGKPATHFTRGWIVPVCSSCDDEK